jgi:TadE-like protein
MKSESGSALVELALVLPMLILMFMGLIDMGRWLHIHVAVSRAAYEGARYGSSLRELPPCTSNCDSQGGYASIAQRSSALLVTYGIHEPALIHSTRLNNPPTIPVTPNNVVRVEVSVPFTPFFNLSPFQPAAVGATKQLGYVGG